jgi:hypothetical protein
VRVLLKVGSPPPSAAHASDDNTNAMTAKSTGVLFMDSPFVN